MGSRKIKRRASAPSINRPPSGTFAHLLPPLSAAGQYVETVSYSGRATNEEPALIQGPTQPDLRLPSAEKFPGATSKETPPDALQMQDIEGTRGEVILVSQARIEERIGNIDSRVLRLENKAMTEWKVALIVFAILAALGGLFGLLKYLI